MAELELGAAAFPPRSYRINHSIGFTPDGYVSGSPQGLIKVDGTFV